MAIKPNHIPKKRLREIWAQVPPDYYDRGIQNNLLQKMWHTRKLTQILKLLPKNTASNFKVLDVGCSSAMLTAEIAKALPKSQVTGLDSYKAAIDLAKSKYPDINFTVADAHDMPFKNQTFDLLVCTETLEHVIDPKGVLEEIKRVIKKDGTLIISMDSGSLLFRIIWNLWTKSKGKVWQDAHLHEFTAKLLEDLTKEAGFRINKKQISHFGMAITLSTTPKTNPKNKRRK